MLRFRKRRGPSPARWAETDSTGRVARPPGPRDLILLMDRLDSGSGASPRFEDERIDSSIESLQQAYAELKKQNQELRDLSERRAASLSYLAHELRTPLTSILGFSEILLSQEQLTDVQQNFVKRIQKSAHQLQNTLTQMSDLYRSKKSPDDIPGE